MAERKHAEAMRLRQEASADRAAIQKKTAKLTEEINRLAIELRMSRQRAETAQTKIGKLTAKIEALEAAAKATPLISQAG